MLLTSLGGSYSDAFPFPNVRLNRPPMLLFPIKALLVSPMLLKCVGSVMIRVLLLM